MRFQKLYVGGFLLGHGLINSLAFAETINFSCSLYVASRNTG